MLQPRILSCSSDELAAAALAAVAARCSEPALLEALAARVAALDAEAQGAAVVRRGIWSAEDAATLAASLGQMQRECHGTQKRRPQPSAGLRSACEVLESHAARQVDDMGWVDLAGALSGLSALGSPGTALTAAARRRVAALSRAVKEGADLDPRHAVRLVATYARMRLRDEVVLGAATEALAIGCGRGLLVPADYLPSLIRSLATQLRPPPRGFDAVVESSLPPAISSFSMSDLVLVVPALAFVPGLRVVSHRDGHGQGGPSFGKSVFGACLAAPLSALKPRALVGVMRSAWALSYADLDFWVPALREVEHSLAAGGATAWSMDDLASASLLAARIVAICNKAEAAAELGEAAAATATWAGETGPPLQAAYPMALTVLQAASATASSRSDELAPRDIAVAAVALAKAKLDDGALFSVLSYRAQVLLSGSSDDKAAPAHKRFGPRDVSQLLVALATFRFRDSMLLTALAQRADADLARYDAKAREMALWAFSELGGLPPGIAADCVLAEALVEYELSKGRATERTEDHLLSVEVLPEDSSNAEATFHVIKNVQPPDAKPDDGSSPAYGRRRRRAR
eukprot:TRINITY_DN70567_c0_g2_i1.p1 TRINITY_DN70567_c0_g2~~TRINITY_DN70567_c0_g2_i1.p1  ORF type:complete len:635 (+),score=155.48 TRINITY_DN70567_c0_g2_i1:181-1905(+)